MTVGHFAKDSQSRLLAVKMVIEPIFEREFIEHSYGFRPGRCCHDALRRADELLQNGWEAEAVRGIEHKR